MCDCLSYNRILKSGRCERYHFWVSTIQPVFWIMKFWVCCCILSCNCVIFLHFVCVFSGHDTLVIFYTSFTSSVGRSIMFFFFILFVSVSVLDRVIMIFLHFICVFSGPFDCDFLYFVCIYCGSCVVCLWFWFFCTSFVSSVGRVFVTFLRFVCICFGPCDCGIFYNSLPFNFRYNYLSEYYILFHIRNTWWQTCHI